MKKQFILSLAFVAFLLGNQWNNLTAQCSSFNASTYQERGKYKTTGDAALDQRFNDEQEYLESFFGVKVDLFMLDDRGAPNAWAKCDHPEHRWTYDGMISFGFHMLQDQLWGNGKGSLAVAGVLAHEFAHIYQCKANTPFGYGNHRRELQADFLAGFYLGNRGYVAESRIREFAQSLFEIGDDEFWDKKHHGTSEQRVTIMYEGFNARNMTLEQAFEHSNQLLRTEGYNRGGSPGRDINTKLPSRSQQRPIVAKTPRPRREFQDRTYVLGIANAPYLSYSLDSIQTYGISAGQLKNKGIGVYGNFTFSPSAFESGEYYTINDYGQSSDSYTILQPTGRQKVGRWELMLGMNKKLFRPFWLQLGAGVYRSKTLWEVNRYYEYNGEYQSTNWVVNTDRATFEPAIEAGLVLNLKWLTLNYSIKNYGLTTTQWFQKVGIGISFESY